MYHLWPVDVFFSRLSFRFVGRVNYFVRLCTVSEYFVIIIAVFELVHLHCIASVHRSVIRLLSNVNVRLTVHHTVWRTINFAIERRYYNDKKFCFTANREFFVLPVQRLIHNWRWCASVWHSIGSDYVTSIGKYALESWIVPYTYTRVAARKSTGKSRQPISNTHTRPDFAMLPYHPNGTTHTCIRIQRRKYGKFSRCTSRCTLIQLTFEIGFFFSGCVCIDASQPCSFHTELFSLSLPLQWFVCISLCICVYEKLNDRYQKKNQFPIVLANVLSLP